MFTNVFCLRDGFEACRKVNKGRGRKWKEFFFVSSSVSSSEMVFIEKYFSWMDRWARRMSIVWVSSPHVMCTDLWLSIQLKGWTSLFTTRQVDAILRWNRQVSCWVRSKCTSEQSSSKPISCMISIIREWINSQFNFWCCSLLKQFCFKSFLCC